MWLALIGDYGRKQDKNMLENEAEARSSLLVTSNILDLGLRLSDFKQVKGMFWLKIRKIILGAAGKLYFSAVYKGTSQKTN